MVVSFLVVSLPLIRPSKTKPKYHAMKTTPATFTVDSDPHDRLLYRMCHFIQAASPPDTGACSVSRSIAATLPAAMLRPLPQAPAGGKKHASLDPPPNLGFHKGMACSALNFRRVHDIRRDLSLPRHSEITPFGCPFALLSALERLWPVQTMTLLGSAKYKKALGLSCTMLSLIAGLC